MIEVIAKMKTGIGSKKIGTLAELLLKVIGQHKVRNSAWLKKDLVIVFVGTAEMKTINYEFRGKNKITDILSFTGDGDLFGELVICLPQIKRQAKEHGLSQQHELRYMLLHGMLHLLGYDHQKSTVEAKRMFALQDRMFAESFRFGRRPRK